MSGSQISLCIIGAGPRGLSVLERLCAAERHQPSHEAVTVHVVDPAPAGAGAVWRTDQARHLLTNTVASQITVYTDDSVKIDGPIEPGPSLYEWAVGLSLVEPLGNQGSPYDEETLAEARRLGPDSYPTRAFYGHYLRDSFRRITQQAPEHLSIRVHSSQAVAMADTHGIQGGPQGIRLADGTRLNDLDAVILTQGHVRARLGPQEARTASLARIHYLTYLPPSNPADSDLGSIEPGEQVLIRGLGLNFFDYLTLLTAGRGGEFTRAHGADRTELIYLPSGEEPQLYAFSRRGIPYHSRGENEKGAFGRYHPRLLTPEHIAGLHRRAADGERLDFAADLWPLISREVEAVYYGTALKALGGSGEFEQFTDRYLELPHGADPGRLLAEYGLDGVRRWDWDTLRDPCAGVTFADRGDFRDWMLDYLIRDVQEARAGNVSGPLKAALDVLRDLRNEIRLAVDHGRLSGDSYRDDLDGWYTPLNAFLSIGPPASRIEEMIALLRAGVLTLLGPGTQVRFNTIEPALIAESTRVPGPPVRATALIEARLPEPDLRRTDDPLLRHLLDTEQCAPYRIPGKDGVPYETGGLSITERPYRLLDASGHPHPRRFAYGVPTEGVHWVTAAGIRPGVDSVTLGDSDAIARAVLELAPAERALRRLEPTGSEAALDGVIV
jgi:hypothetical protein